MVTNLEGTDYENDWYLPSIAELFQIFANGKGVNKVFDIEAASEALGGDKFGTDVYWSSTPSSSNNAYILNFNGGGTQNHVRATQRYFCCIRAFN